MQERFPAIRITMLPRDANAYGTIFGGVILSYIDLAGGIEARRQSAQKYVTKAMREVVFVAPVYLGDLVTFYTSTIRVGKTSITIDIDVEVERLGPTGNREVLKVTQAEVTYVAVDEKGRSNDDPQMKREPVYIVDALNYIFRAYHGLPDDITSPSGMLTNAVLGYLRTLLRIVKERKPQYMAAAFEGDTSFRSQMFTPYKANRSQMPANLAPQIEYCRRITEAMGVPTFRAADYEADDVIGTIAVRMWALGYPAVIVTGDKDMSQLVCEGICVYDMAREVWLDEPGVRAKFGVSPTQIPDLLALHGDSVDNIPGVPGIGPKTAQQLLSVCSGIDDLTGPPDRFQSVAIRGRNGHLQRIRDNIDVVRLSRKLATICCEVPLTVTPESVRYRKGTPAILRPLCAELGLKHMFNDIPLAQATLF